MKVNYYSLPLPQRASLPSVPEHLVQYWNYDICNVYWINQAAVAADLFTFQLLCTFEVAVAQGLNHQQEEKDSIKHKALGICELKFQFLVF